MTRGHGGLKADTTTGCLRQIRSGLGKGMANNSGYGDAGNESMHMKHTTHLVANVFLAVNPYISSCLLFSVHPTLNPRYVHLRSQNFPRRYGLGFRLGLEFVEARPTRTQPPLVTCILLIVPRQPSRAHINDTSGAGPPSNLFCDIIMKPSNLQCVLTAVDKPITQQPMDICLAVMCLDILETNEFAGVNQGRDRASICLPEHDRRSPL